MHLPWLYCEAVNKHCCFINTFVSFRIGDIVLGGSLTILVYVTVAIFLTLRRPLLIMNDKEEMLKYLKQVGYSKSWA